MFRRTTYKLGFTLHNVYRLVKCSITRADVNCQISLFSITFNQVQRTSLSRVVLVNENAL